MVPVEQWLVSRRLYRSLWRRADSYTHANSYTHADSYPDTNTDSYADTNTERGVSE